MPEFEKSKGFKMKGPTFFKSALKKYGKAPMKDYDVKKGSHDHPHGKPSPAIKGKFGKILGGVLTGGLSTAIGAIRKKRKGGVAEDPAAAAADPTAAAPMMKKGKSPAKAKPYGASKKGETRYKKKPTFSRSPGSIYYDPKAVEELKGSGKKAKSPVKDQKSRMEWDKDKKKWVDSAKNAAHNKAHTEERKKKK